MEGNILVLSSSFMHLSHEVQDPNGVLVHLVPLTGSVLMYIISLIAL